MTMITTTTATIKEKTSDLKSKCTKKIVKNERRCNKAKNAREKRKIFFELAVRRNTIAFKLHLVCNEPT